MATPLASRFARVVVDVPLPQPLDYRLASSERVGRAGVRRPGRAAIPDGADRRHRPPDRHRSSSPQGCRLRRRPGAAARSPLARLHAVRVRLLPASMGRGCAAGAAPCAEERPPGPRFAQALARLRKREVAAGRTRRRCIASRPSSRPPSRRCSPRGDSGSTCCSASPAAARRRCTSGRSKIGCETDERAQVLMLVPEINLTPQLESLLRARFGAAGVVVLHSGLPDGERSAAWLAAHEGRARIVVGTRLAVFASMPALALIVVDEEHDPVVQGGRGRSLLRARSRDQACADARRAGRARVGDTVARDLGGRAGRALHAAAADAARGRRRRRASRDRTRRPALTRGQGRHGHRGAGRDRAEGRARGRRPVAGLPEPARLCARRRLRCVRVAVALPAVLHLHGVPQDRSLAALPSLRLHRTRAARLPDLRQPGAARHGARHAANRRAAARAAPRPRA